MFGVVRINGRPRLAIAAEDVPAGKQLEGVRGFDPLRRSGR
jgi:hypothetical protein